MSVVELWLNKNDKKSKNKCVENPKSKPHFSGWRRACFLLYLGLKTSGFCPCRAFWWAQTCLIAVMDRCWQHCRCDVLWFFWGFFFTLSRNRKSFIWPVKSNIFATSEWVYTSLQDAFPSVLICVSSVFHKGTTQIKKSTRSVLHTQGCFCFISTVKFWSTSSTILGDKNCSVASAC